jgi:hypothetical protein
MPPKPTFARASTEDGKPRPVNHVGELHNLAAGLIANDLVERIRDGRERD